jgi:hypothetical protein
LSTTTKLPDVLVIDHGSLIGMTPMSDAGRSWMREHIPDDAQWLGRQLMVEPRYAPAIMEGMQDAGLELR